MGNTNQLSINYHDKENAQNASNYISNQKNFTPIQTKMKRCQTDSRNKLKPTSKLGLQFMHSTTMSTDKSLIPQNPLTDKSLSSQSAQDIERRLFLDEDIQNPLNKLKQKKQLNGNASNRPKPSGQQKSLLELLKIINKHQDCQEDRPLRFQDRMKKRSNMTEIQLENSLDLDAISHQTPLFQHNDKKVFFNDKKQSRPLQEQKLLSFKKELPSQNDSLEEVQQHPNYNPPTSNEALQFILQNCTQTFSRTHRIDSKQLSPSIEFDTLMSDFNSLGQKRTAKRSQGATPGTAHFNIAAINQEIQKSVLDLSMSQISEVASVKKVFNFEDPCYTRQTSCVEHNFQAPQDTPNNMSCLMDSIDHLQKLSSVALRDRRSISLFNNKSQNSIDFESKPMDYMQKDTTSTRYDPKQSLTYPEEEWLKNSQKSSNHHQLELRKIMFMLDKPTCLDVPQYNMILPQQFSVNPSEMISLSSDLNRSQDKSTQTSRLTSQHNQSVYDRLSKPKVKEVSIDINQPYWKLRESVSRNQSNLQIKNNFTNNERSKRNSFKKMK